MSTSTTTTATGPSNAPDLTLNGGSASDRGFKVCDVNSVVVPHLKLLWQRKFEDALYNLDKAVESSTSRPAKKTKLSNSVYSTLAKYGIKKDAKPYVRTLKPDDCCPTSSIVLADKQHLCRQDQDWRVFLRPLLISSFF